jgi:hypothetical protein
VNTLLYLHHRVIVVDLTIKELLISTFCEIKACIFDKASIFDKRVSSTSE